jgi:hypothetical protein
MRPRDDANLMRLPTRWRSTFEITGTWRRSILEHPARIYWEPEGLYVIEAEGRTNVGELVEQCLSSIVTFAFPYLMIAVTTDRPHPTPITSLHPMEQLTRARGVFIGLHELHGVDVVETILRVRHVGGITRLGIPSDHARLSLLAEMRRVGVEIAYPELPAPPFAWPSPDAEGDVGIRVVSMPMRSRNDNRPSTRRRAAFNGQTRT